VSKAKQNLPTSPRSRLVAAAKHLFSRRGYEAASTAAIAKQAKTSESQLMRLFGGKSGLLDAIFNDTWLILNGEINARIAESTTGRDAIMTAYEVIAEGFRHDPEVATLFLFEARRIRGTQVALSRGSVEFFTLFRGLVERGHHDGSVSRDFSTSTITAALIGCGEGMLRDRLLAERSGAPAPFDDETMLRALGRAVAGFSA
jgi:AcrR family transcriptional regulator